MFSDGGRGGRVEGRGGGREPKYSPPLPPQPPSVSDSLTPHEHSQPWLGLQGFTTSLAYIRNSKQDLGFYGGPHSQPTFAKGK